MKLKLMYITNDPQVAKIADRAGVDRVFIDLETVGKEQRQGGMNTVQSHHTTDDVKQIRTVLRNAELLVRVNPIHEGSEKEINTVVENGADILMLPYFQNKEQVQTFLSYVNRRVKTILLVETPEAVEHLDEILSLDGIDECHIGLNDLHLSYKKKFMFELLADGTVERITEKFKRRGIPFGFGGIARIGQGTLPAERILAEHIRIGSQAVILSRSFCNADMIRDYLQIEHLFMSEIKKMRETESTLRGESAQYFEQNHRSVQKIVNQITESIE